MTCPWRVLLIGSEPTALIESNIVTSLNPPSAIADTSWIKPGKAAWNDWWSGDSASGVTTASLERYIDFASESKTRISPHRRRLGHARRRRSPA